MVKTMEELDMELCEYCEVKDKVFINNMYCFDTGQCEKAYQNYLDLGEDEE